MEAEELKHGKYYKITYRYAGGEFIDTMFFDKKIDDKFKFDEQNWAGDILLVKSNDLIKIEQP